MRSCAGDWVEVRSKAEILATLDKNGRLENMPFMPEMFEYCGKRIRVHKRAHKSCDTLNPMSQRSLEGGVILEGVRCSGAAHAGCQAACSIFWKEAWLKPADGPTAEADASPAPAPANDVGCTEADVERAVLKPDAPAGEVRYQCQATDFPSYTTFLRSRQIGQYIEDIRSRNETFVSAFRTFAYFAFKAIAGPEADKVRRPLRDLYTGLRGLWGGVPWPRLRGKLAKGEKGPIAGLKLQPGELVRVKPYEEILAIIDAEKNSDRGLYFDAEMVPYCGGVFRVRSQIEKFVDERDGSIRHMKTPAVILENVWCRSRFSAYRLLCPRVIYSWWREAWLERAPEATQESAAESLGARSILKQLS